MCCNSRLDPVLKELFSKWELLLLYIAWLSTCSPHWPCSCRLSRTITVFPSSQLTWVFFSKEWWVTPFWSFRYSVPPCHLNKQDEADPDHFKFINFYLICLNLFLFLPVLLDILTYSTRCLSVDLTMYIMKCLSQ